MKMCTMNITHCFDHVFVPDDTIKRTIQNILKHICYGMASVQTPKLLCLFNDSQASKILINPLCSQTAERNWLTLLVQISAVKLKAEMSRNNE